MMKAPSLAVFVIATLFFAPALSAKNSLLERTEGESRLRKEITRLDLSASISLIDTDIVSGIGFGTKYKAEVEPAYLDGIFTRIDRWSLEANFKPGDIIEELGSPIYAGIRKGAEVVFVRHYKNQRKAITASPKIDPRKIPLTAELAKTHLRLGESVLLPVDLNLFTGIQGTANTYPLKASVGSNLFLTGRFILQVLKITESKVRLRLVAQRSNGRQVGATAATDFDIFDVGLLDSAMEKLLIDDFLKLSKTKSKGVLFIADYLFDLDNIDAAQAYNDILATGYQFKNFEIINPFKSATDVSKIFINDLSHAEKIAQEDLELPMNERRVTRIFQGLNTYRSEGFNLRFGLEFAKWQGSESITENKVNFIDRNSSKSRFLYPTSHKRSESKFLWGYYREKKHRSRSILYDLDSEEESFTNYVVNMEIKDKKLSTREAGQTYSDLSRNIRPEILNQFDLEYFRTQSKLSNARVYAQIVFHYETFSRLQGIKLSDLKVFFKQYIENNGLSKELRELQTRRTKRLGHPGRRTGSSYKESFVDHTTPFLEALDRLIHADIQIKATQTDILKEFTKLKDNPVYDRFSTGFFMSLLPQTNLENYVFVRIQTDSLETLSQTQTFGDEERLETLTAMEYIQNLIQNGAFDLRLQTFGTPIRTID